MGVKSGSDQIGGIAIAAMAERSVVLNKSGQFEASTLTDYSSATLNSSQTLGTATEIFADASGGALTFDLPQASTVTGRAYTVIKIDSSAATVTLDPYSTETINGSSTLVLSSQWESVQIVSDGSNWVLRGGDASAGIIWTRASGKVYLTTSTDSVGIGITNPGSSLHVYNSSGAGVTLSDGGSGAPARRNMLYLNNSDTDRAAGMLVSEGGTEKWFIGKIYNDDVFSIGYHSSQSEYITNSKFAINASGLVGINAAPTTLSQVKVDGGLWASNPGSYDALDVFGPDVTVTGAEANYIKALYAEQFRADISTGVTDSGYRIAVDASSFISDADFEGTLTNQYSVWARHGVTTGTGTITNSYGIWIDTLSSTGTITNAYQLYLSNNAFTGTVTNYWGIYQADGAATNYFAGTTGIGTNDPQQLLNVGDASSLSYTTTPDKAILVASTTEGHEVAYLAQVAEGTNNLRAKFFVDDATTLVGIDATYSSGLIGIAHQISGSTKLLINTDGHVGINETSPKEWIHIGLASSWSLLLGTGDTSNISGNIYYDGGYKHVATGVGTIHTVNDAGSYVWYTCPSAVANAAATLVPRMSIENDGDIVLGSSTAGSDNTLVEIVERTITSAGTNEAGLYARCPNRTISSAEASNAYKAITADSSQADVGPGVSGGGRTSIIAWGAINDTNFEGTLNANGIWVGHGIYSATAGASLGTSVGVEVAAYTLAGTTVTTLIGFSQYVAQGTQEAENRFSGPTRIGGYATPTARLDVVGQKDEPQFKVKGYSTQTNDTMLVEASDGTDQLRILGTTSAPRTPGQLVVGAGTPNTWWSGGNTLELMPYEGPTAGLWYNALQVWAPTRTVDSNETNHLGGLDIVLTKADIASGVTDSGSYQAIEIDCYISDTNFEGTLTTQNGMWLGHGIYSAGAAGARTITNSTGLWITTDYVEGTITNAYGLRLDTASGGSCTNLWAIYQEATAAKNYFAGSTGIGTNDPDQLLSIKEQAAATAAIRFDDTDDSELAEIGVARATDDLLTGSSNLDLVVKNNQSADIIFATNDTDRLRVMSGGALRMADITAPGTPASGYGYLYVNSDTLYFKDDGGVVYNLLAESPSAVHTGADESLGESSTSEEASATSLFIPANTISAGSAYKVTMAGSVNTDVGTAQLTIRARYSTAADPTGGDLLLSAVTTPSSDASFFFEGYVVFEAAGVGGNTQGGGLYYDLGGTHYLPIVLDASVNTTADRSIYVTGQSDTSSANNYVLVKQLIIQKIV